MLFLQSHHVPYGQDDLILHSILTGVVSDNSGGRRRQCAGLAERGRVPVFSPSKYPGTRRLVRSMKVAGSRRRRHFYTLNTSSVVTPMRPCGAGNQEPIGFPDVWCRRLIEWLILRLSMFGSDGERFVTSL